MKSRRNLVLALINPARTFSQRGFLGAQCSSRALLPRICASQVKKENPARPPPLVQALVFETHTMGGAQNAQRTTIYIYTYNHTYVCK